MKTLLVGINSKYVHTNLAIRNIKAYCNDDDIYIYEATINDNVDEILDDIIMEKADVIGFSCYIWNTDLILELSQNIKKVMPETKVVLGGPEVTYDAKNLLIQNPYIDFIIMGEGEDRFCKLFNVLNNSMQGFEKIDGLAFRDGANIKTTSPEGFMDLNEIPMSYEQSEDLENKLVYYETSRGCPFNCAFCISSIEKGVRFSSLSKIEKDLLFFVKKGVRVVKLVDRSFNCNRGRAIKIFDIIRRLGKDTIFHCEINPELVDEEFAKSLDEIKERLQFEVGVQTVNLEALKAINRTTNVEKTLKGIEILKKAGVKLHVDLIAGLPYEDFESFSHSFDKVFNLYPEEIQLGFLKLLKGTSIRKRADKYGIVYRSKAPYEILYNDWISYEELSILKGIARLVDKYYNDGRFYHSLTFLLKFFDRPFELFYSLNNFFIKNDVYKRNHSLKARYDLLFKFGVSLGIDEELLRDYINFDYRYFNGKSGGNLTCSRKVNMKALWQRASQYIYDEEWVQKNLPIAANLSGNEISKYIIAQAFEHDIPESTEIKKIGVVFYKKGEMSRYAKFNI